MHPSVPQSGGAGNGRARIGAGQTCGAQARSADLGRKWRVCHATPRVRRAPMCGEGRCGASQGPTSESWRAAGPAPGRWMPALQGGTRQPKPKVAVGPAVAQKCAMRAPRWRKRTTVLGRVRASVTPAPSVRAGTPLLLLLVLQLLLVRPPQLLRLPPQRLLLLPLLRRVLHCLSFVATPREAGLHAISGAAGVERRAFARAVLRHSSSLRGRGQDPEVGPRVRPQDPEVGVRILRSRSGS